MSDPDRCPQCGAELSADALGGLCPKCLLAAGLGSGAEVGQAAGSGSDAPTTPHSGSFVPPDAAWETTPEGLRYELAIQTPDTPMEASRLDLGETRLPDDLGIARAELGTIRVVTSPPGAKVYLLVGFTPDVRVENVGTEEVVELLVFLEGHEVERVVVAPSDWHDTEDGTRSAELDVTLRERARR